MRPWYREPLLVCAAVVFGAASIVVLSSTEHALADVTSTGSTGPRRELPVPQIEQPGGLSAELLARIVDHDLFHPERRRPGVPFRLPSEQAAQLAAPPPAPTPQLRLLGTVVTPGQDAFVMAQLGSEAPRVLRVGGKLGGYSLLKIEPGRAVFAAPNGESMDLHVPKSGSQ